MKEQNSIQTCFTSYYKSLYFNILFSIAFAILLFLLSSNSVFAATVTVNCSGTSGSPTAVTEADLLDDDVTFADTGGDGYCELDAAINAASITIDAGVIITHPEESSVGVSIETTGNLTVNGIIDVNEKGCPLNEGATALNTCEDAGDSLGGEGTAGSGGGYGGGAGHGGAGGQGHQAGFYGGPGSAYDSSTHPVYFGSGGGDWNGSDPTTYGTAGAGGGLVSLIIGGDADVDGSITANGGDATIHQGGGSGGSIYLAVSGDLTGIGTITADGGAGAGYGGGGGGGIIAVYYTGGTVSTLQSNDSSAGGARGGTGNSAAGVAGGVYYELVSAPSIPGGSIAINCAGPISNPTSISEASYSTSDDLFLYYGGGDGYCELDAALSVGSMTINTDAILTHPEESVTGVTITTTGNLTLTGDIDVEEKGCPMNEGPSSSNICSDGGDSLGGEGGASGSGGYGGGAGHGGAGGQGHTSGFGPAGSTYDSSSEPVLFGAGGGDYNGETVGTAGTAGAGGGLVKLTVGGDSILNGTINANGGDAYLHQGGGSGGTIYVNTTGSVTGTGTLTVDGGDGAGYGGGAGGGIMAIYYGSGDVSTLQTNDSASAGLQGGTGSSQAGSAGLIAYTQTVGISSAVASASSGSTVDTLTLTFSTNVDITDDGGSGDGFDAITISASSGSCSIDNADYSATNTSTLTLNLTCTGAAVNNTAVTVDPTYDTGGASTVLIASGATEVVNGYTVTGTETLPPLAPSDLAKSGGTGTTAVLTWTATSATDFGTYKIWYGTNQSDVQNRNGTATAWDSGSDGDLSTVSTATTTITGLTAGNTYYAMLCDEDTSGNDDCESDISFVTNQTPSASTPTSISQATDGTGYVTFVTTVSDSDLDETKLQVEYSDDNGSTWYDAYIASATPDSGTVDLDNGETYQIGTVDGIDTDSGSTDLTVVWDSKSALNGNGALTTEETDIKVRVVVNDSIISASAAESTAFSVDNGSPSGLASFVSTATTSSTITWGWTAVSSESNFDHYEIWYGEVQSDVNNRTGTASEWDDSDDGDLATVGTNTTTITGLSEDTTYYAKIFAVDTFGNETTLSAATANNNGRPTLSAATITQATDGSGTVTITFTIDDADDDDTLRVRAEYNIGAGWVDIEISESSGDITSTFGSLNVENDNIYQIGNSSGYLESSSGANTITLKWDTQNQSGGNSFDSNTASVRLTPNDISENGATLEVTGVTLDNAAPGSFADLAAGADNSGLAVSWTAATDTNFDHYEVWYGEVESDVTNTTGTAIEWDNTDDSDLLDKTTTQTVITGIDVSSPGVSYFVRAFAYDSLGNVSALATTSFSTGVAGASSSSGSSSVSSVVGDVQTITIDEDGNIAILERPASTIPEKAGVKRKQQNILFKKRVEYAFNPLDADKDGLLDEDELIYGTDINNRDTDKDGITDGQEVYRFKSNPLSVDSDNDGITDGQEVLNAFNPIDPCSPASNTFAIKYGNNCEARKVFVQNYFKDFAFKEEEKTSTEEVELDENDEEEEILTIDVPTTEKPGVEEEVELDEEIEEEKTIIFPEIIERDAGTWKKPVVKIPVVEEPKVQKPNLDNLNKSVQLALELQKKEYDLSKPAGRLEKALDQELTIQAPWSRTHYRALLNNEVISANLENSSELSNFLEDIISNPNNEVTQTDAIKLLIAMTLDETSEPDDLDSLVESFDEQSLKVAEQRNVIGLLETLSENGLTRGQALMLLFNSSSKEFRTGFISSVLNDFSPSKLPFKDIVLGDPLAPYVYFFYSRGLIDGFEDNTFRLDAVMTNAEFVKLMTTVQKEIDRIEDLATSIGLTSKLGDTIQNSVIQSPVSNVELYSKRMIPIEVHIRKQQALKRFMQMFFK